MYCKCIDFPVDASLHCTPATASLSGFYNLIEGKGPYLCASADEALGLPAC